MIELSHVSKSYGTGGKAIRDLSLTIEDGEFVFYHRPERFWKEYIDQAPDEGA